MKRQVEEMIEELRTTVDSRIDAVVEFSEHWLSGPRHPYQIAADAPIVQSLDRAVRAVMSGEPIYQGVPFWCDLVALEEFGVRGVNFGPGDPPYNFPDEYVYEAQYLELVHAVIARLECRGDEDVRGCAARYRRAAVTTSDFPLITLKKIPAIISYAASVG